MGSAQAVGRYGEKVAVDHLERSGFIVLGRNWRCRYGELDIVAMDGDTVVGVEVKTRRSLAFGHPVEAVTRQKAARLRRLLAQWLSENDVHAPGVRIDVIAIVRPRRGAAELLHLRGVA
ncbi:MAG TPA: YraN family protein [Actinomycetales bacterium]|nr:YraN family protein [Actinomycetales bacterium]